MIRHKSLWILLTAVLLLAGCIGVWRMLFYEQKAEPVDMTPTPYADPTLLYPARDTTTWLWGCMDATGQWVIPARYDYIYGFSCGYSPVDYQGIPAFLSTDGRICRPEGIEMDENYTLDFFCYGYAIISHLVSDDDGNYYERYGLVDTTMQVVVPLQYYGMSRMSANGLLPVQVAKEGPWGYIDATGREVLPAIYSGADEFFGGLAPVAKDDRWGLINTRGEEVVAPQYDYLWPLGTDRWAALDQDGYQAVIDRRGKEIVASGIYDQYVPSRSMTGPICCFDAVTGYAGWIDQDGREVCSFTFDESLPFDGGYALGIDYGENRCTVHVVDRRGVVVYSFEADGNYSEGTDLHNGMIQLQTEIFGIRSAGALVTLQGDTLQNWTYRMD